MNFAKTLKTLLIAGAMVPVVAADAREAREVPGMPSNVEWSNMLLTSQHAFVLAKCTNGCMPTEAVWNAVLDEDKLEMSRGFASQEQLNLDVHIGQLLSEARVAIAANDTQKIHDIGAKLEDGLNRRMKIIATIANNDWRRHSHQIGVADSLGTVPLGGYGAVNRSYGQSSSKGCVVVQGQGWTGCAPQ